MKKAPAPEKVFEENDPFLSLPQWFTEREVIPLEDHLALVVCHETMRAIVALCRDIADSPAPVLLTGETGVGKSLLCRFIHASGDPYAPFVPLLTAGLGEKVLLERLFGLPGVVEDDAPQPLVTEAAGGTLVLEEMGDLPPQVQERLMAYWDAGTGDGEWGQQEADQTETGQAEAGRKEASGEGTCPAMARRAGPLRFLCTTNTPPARLLAPGALLPAFLERFRRIHVPPLRERKEDIPALVAYFSRLKSSRAESLKGLKTLATRLADHAFPGNVRELESLMALEAGGLPWRWRITDAGKGACVQAKPRTTHAQAKE
ncbi:sigma 54-interacting transcriptional regulator [Humidesulfovibrio idahonensis]